MCVRHKSIFGIVKLLVRWQISESHFDMTNLQEVRKITEKLETSRINNEKYHRKNWESNQNLYTTVER